MSAEEMIGTEEGGEEVVSVDPQNDPEQEGASSTGFEQMPDGTLVSKEDALAWDKE